MPAPRDPARHEAWRLAIKRSWQRRILEGLANPRPPLPSDDPHARLLQQPIAIDHEALARHVRSLEATAALLVAEADRHPRFGPAVVGAHVKRELAGVIVAVEQAQRNLADALAMLRSTT